MKAAEIVTTAKSLVSGDRSRQHGDKLDNHQRIADLWNGLLAAAGKRTVHPLDAHDVANMMEGLKIARRYTGEFNADDYVDGAGYSAVAGEVRAAQIARDTTWVPPVPAKARKAKPKRKARR